MTVLAATESGLHEIGPRRRTRLEGRLVNAVAPRDGGWWAVADRHDLIRGDGAEAALAARLETTRIWSVLEADGLVLVGGSHGRLYRLCGDRLEPVTSFDAAEGRDAWYAPPGNDVQVRSLSRGADGALYANVHVGGVLRSLEYGERWAQTLDIHADVHQVLAHPNEPGRVVAAAAVGFGTSEDAGASWAFDSEGLHAPYLRAVAIGEGAVYASASSGPGATRGAVYRKPSKEEPFERCREGLPEWFPGNINTGCIAACGAAVVVGDAAGRVHLSEDSGTSWRLVTDGLPPIRALLLI